MKYTTRLETTTEEEMMEIITRSRQPNMASVPVAEIGTFGLIPHEDYEGDKILVHRTKIDHIDHIEVSWKKEYRPNVQWGHPAKTVMTG